MARKSLKLYWLNMLLTIIIYTVLGEIAIAFPSSGHREPRRSKKPPSNDQAVRLHPGVIASVVVVVVAAVVAAVFIVRKYCCPQSNATYRYSELRQQVEQNAAAEEDSDSDEDLLE